MITHSCVNIYNPKLVQILLGKLCVHIIRTLLEIYIKWCHFMGKFCSATTTPGLWILGLCRALLNTLSTHQSSDKPGETKETGGGVVLLILLTPFFPTRSFGLRRNRFWSTFLGYYRMGLSSFEIELPGDDFVIFAWNSVCPLLLIIMILTKYAKWPRIKGAPVFLGSNGSDPIFSTLSPNLF